MMLKNNKYFLGRYNEMGHFKGWFVGAFFPDGHPCKTDKVEMLYKEHEKGDSGKPHYHQEKIEVIIMLDGEAKYSINGQVVFLKSGNFLFIDTDNIISCEFLKPSKILVVHSPSIPADKVLITDSE